MSDLIFKIGITLAVGGLMVGVLGLPAGLIHPALGGGLIVFGFSSCVVGMFCCLTYMVTDMWQGPK